MYKQIIETPHIVAGITVKNSQLPEGGNMALHTCREVADVIANREKLAATLGIPLSQFVFANQTHSANMAEIKREDAGKGAYTMTDAIDQVDALYTFEKDILLTTFTADCVPLIFYEVESGLIGTIHSGWKGTVQSITEKVFQYLQAEKNVKPSQVNVHIGTCLSQANFEVDQDVASQFQALGYADDNIFYDQAKHKYLIDNQEVVRQQCIRAGIASEKISIDPTCTMDAKDGFSYREDKKAGRHLSFIIRK